VEVAKSSNFRSAEVERNEEDAELLECDLKGLFEWEDVFTGQSSMILLNCQWVLSGIHSTDGIKRLKMGRSRSCRFGMRIYLNPHPSKIERSWHPKAASGSRVGPLEGGVAVGEGAHLDGGEVAEEVDVGEADFLPGGGVFGADAGVDEDDDTVAGGDELFGFADDFGDGGAGGGEIFFRAIAAVVGAAAGEFGGFAPVDVGVKGLDGGVDVAAVEGGIGGAEDGDALGGLSRVWHGRFWVIAGVQENYKCEECQGAIHRMVGSEALDEFDAHGGESDERRASRREERADMGRSSAAPVQDLRFKFLGAGGGVSRYRVLRDQ
jgi:hypothetical protein